MNADEYRKWLEEEAARVASARRPKEKPYDGRGMDMERMPLGCWMLIIGFGIILFLAFSKFAL